MDRDLEAARKRLLAGGVTCVLRKGETEYVSTDRGLAPLTAWIEAGTNLQGYAAADKIVGKAAACLYALLGVKAVYAPVMSREAISFFSQHGIEAFPDKIAEDIRNRAGTGICPMEQAVKPCQTPEEAFQAVRRKQADLISGRPTAGE